jgi:hypothetical protein
MPGILPIPLVWEVGVAPVSRSALTGGFICPIE